MSGMNKMTTPLRPRIIGCEHKFDSVVQCPTCGVPNTMVQWRLEAEAAPDLRAALERLVNEAEHERSKGACDGWVHPLPDDPSKGHEPGQDTIHVLPFHHDGDPCDFCDALEQARSALAAPAADGLDWDRMARAYDGHWDLADENYHECGSECITLIRTAYLREPSREPRETLRWLSQDADDLGIYTEPSREPGEEG